MATHKKLWGSEITTKDWERILRRFPKASDSPRILEKLRESNNNPVRRSWRSSSSGLYFHVTEVMRENVNANLRAKELPYRVATINKRVNLVLVRVRKVLKKRRSK